MTETKVNTTELANTVGMVELGRATAGSATDTLTVNFTAKKYLRIEIFSQGSGVVSQYLRFNNDSGSNYLWRYSQDGAADATQAATTQFNITSGDTNNPSLIIIEVTNYTSSEKDFYSRVIIGATGTGTIPHRIEYGGKWVNTSAQINRVDLVNSNTGDFATGTEIIVYGHD